MNTITQNTKITSSDINTLISECNNKLSLSGGTLTGTLRKEIGTLFSGLRDDAYHVINGGTDYKKGARIVLSGKDAEGWNGELQLEANDGTNMNVLRIMPSGVAYLHNERILTSDYGVTLSSSQVITGQKTFTSTPIFKSSNNDKIILKHQSDLINTNPSSDNSNKLWFYDSANNAYAVLQSIHKTNGALIFGLTSRAKTTYDWSFLNLLQYTDGTSEVITSASKMTLANGSLWIA